MKSRSASCPTISEPQSSIVFAAVSSHVSHDGSSIHPSRIAGREPLAGGADVHDLLRRESLQGADRHAVVAKLGVVVVLDDQPLLLGPLDQGGASLRREHRAGRELVRGSEQHRRGLRRGKHVDAQPALVDRDRHDLEAGLFDDQPVQMPAWILERHLLDAVSAQRSAQQREALA